MSSVAHVQRGHRFIAFVHVIYVMNNGAIFAHTTQTHPTLSARHFLSLPMFDILIYNTHMNFSIDSHVYTAHSL